MSYALNGVPFATLGVRAATHMENRAAEASMKIVTNEASGYFVPGSQYVLAGGGPFVGWLDQPGRRLSPSSRHWEYVLTGGQRQLANSTVQQAFQYLIMTPDGIQVVDAGSTGLTMMGRVVDGDGGQGHTSLGVAVDQILNYALTDVGGFSYSLTADLAAAVPWEARQDDKALFALRALLKWAPDTVARWDGTLLRVFTPNYGFVSTINPGLRGMRDDLVITPRYDLLCAETRIIYLQRVQTLSGAIAYERQMDTASGGPDVPPGWSQKAVVTIFLEEGEPIPMGGIAAIFQRHAGRLQSSATATFDGLYWGDRPGDVWNTGGSASMAGNLMVCQQITRDLFKNVQTNSYGPPSQLGLADMIALKRKPYRRPNPGAPPQDLNDNIGALSITLLTDPADDQNFPEDSVYWSVTPGTGGGAGTGSASGLGPTTISLPPGNYVVKFGVVPGYKSPDAIPVGIAKDETSTAQGIFKVSKDARHPFFPEVKNLGTEGSPTWVLKIGEGVVYKSLQNRSAHTITGLEPEYDIAADDYYWLTGTYEDGELSEIEVGVGSDVPNPIVVTSGEEAEQSKWTAVLGKIVAEGDKVMAEPYVTCNLVLRRGCVGSVSCDCPEPYPI